MPGKRYSAGAIFLQVVPVFGNVQNAIRDEAKEIDRALGDQMERSGEKAGERAGKAASKKMSEEFAKSNIGKDLERQLNEGVSGINKALGNINTKNLGKKLRAEVKQMQAELDSLGDVDIRIDDNVAQVAARVKALKAQVENMRTRSGVFFDIKGLPEVYRGVAKAQAAIDGINGDIELDVDAKKVDRQMGAFEKKFKATCKKAAAHLDGQVGEAADKLRTELRYLENLRIGIDISSNRARAELKEIGVEIEALSNTKEIDLRVDAGKAFAEVKAFDKALDKVDKRVAKAKVKVDGTKQAARDGDVAANAFRSFNIVLLAAVSVGPALIPILGAIAGGLLALGPAAAVGAFGLGAVLVGFSGLGNAITALQAQQDAAATGADAAAKKQKSASYAIVDALDALADARRNAARAAEDAAEAVADARDAAADAIEDALARQKEAQEDYRDSVKDVADAEQALRDARADAAAEAATIADRQRKNNVDERDAEQKLLDAQVNYDTVMSDGSSTNTDKERASIDLEYAQIALNDVRKEQVALGEEAADFAKNGVDGNEKVQTAQEQLTDAIAAQKEATEAIKEAARDADEVRKDGADSVADALRSQNRTLADNKEAIEDAIEALRRAREQGVDDLQAIDAQALAVKNAFDKLGPAGAAFATFLFGLRGGFYQFRDDIQQVMLPAIQEAIEGFIASTNAPKARNALINLAAGFGDFVKALSMSFQGPAWAKFFDMLAETGPKIMDAYGGAFIKMFEGLASLLTTAAPFALDFARGFERMMEAFATGQAGGEGMQMVIDFIDYVKRVGGPVREFFSQLGTTFIHVVEALAPYSEMILSLLTNFLEFVANIPIDTLGTVLAAILALVTASQIAYGIFTLVISIGTLVTSTIALIVFAFVGIGLAIAYLYHTNEDFRDFMQEAWARIKDAVVKAWEDHIKPALEKLRDAFMELWEKVLQPLLAWLGPKLLWLAEHVIPLLAIIFANTVNNIAFFITEILIPAVGWMVDAFKWLKGKLIYFWNQLTDGWTDLVNGIKWAYENILKKTWDDISTAAKYLWKRFTDGFVQIKDGWDAAIGGIKSVWEEVLKPMWDAIKNDALPALQEAFSDTIDTIGRIWDRLKGMAAVPVKFVIEDVINGGLIAGFNKVASWVGSKGIDEIKVPEWAQNYATGGVLPGYTPGRDPHVFHSATAGTLALSGGEAIMRPEWTAAMGKAGVDYWNSLARSGGVGAVRKAMQTQRNYWMGGILPLPGAAVSQHTSGYSGYAADLNYAGYSDYGKALGAWKPGVLAQKNYVGDDSYGRWVVVNHAGGQSSLYAHLSAFSDAAVGSAIAAGQTVGYVGDLGNTGTPPTSHLHFEINGGTVDYADSAGGDGKSSKKKHPPIPGDIMKVIRDPLGAFKGWITAPLGNATEAMKASPIWGPATKAPAMLGEKVTNKVWDIIPGWAKTAAGWAGGAANWAVGGVKNAASAAADAAKGVGGAIKSGAQSVGDFLDLGFANGGVLPYNGTMKYDAGGYLPPGLTNVVNLTGKPEPVFTADQFDGMGNGKGANIDQSMHFHEVMVDADSIMDKARHEQRKQRLEGRYGRNRS